MQYLENIYSELSAVSSSSKYLKSDIPFPAILGGYIPISTILGWVCSDFQNVKEGMRKFQHFLGVACSNFNNFSGGISIYWRF